MTEINTITVNNVDYDIYDNRITALDSTPTQGSANPVTSGGVAAYVTAELAKVPKGPTISTSGDTLTINTK